MKPPVAMVSNARIIMAAQRILSIGWAVLQYPADAAIAAVI